MSVFVYDVYARVHATDKQCKPACDSACLTIQHQCHTPWSWPFIYRQSKKNCFINMLSVSRKEFKTKAQGKKNQETQNFTATDARYRSLQHETLRMRVVQFERPSCPLRFQAALAVFVIAKWKTKKGKFEADKYTIRSRQATHTGAPTSCRAVDAFTSAHQNVKLYSPPISKRHRTPRELEPYKNDMLVTKRKESIAVKWRNAAPSLQSN